MLTLAPAPQRATSHEPPPPSALEHQRVDEPPDAPGWPARERRAAPSHATRALNHCLELTLDEIGYGVLLLDLAGRVVHTNHVARHELGGDHPLYASSDGRLIAHLADDGRLLAEALAAAAHGVRRMLRLGRDPVRVNVAVVPLLARDGASAGAGWIALLLGARQGCEPLSLQCFAKHHGLTPAETRVLEALAAGTSPADIARMFGVALATVRTQISAIRAKTGTENIRALVRLVAVLPPMVGVLRG